MKELPDQKNICAVITSYNPDGGFIERFQKISKQVSKVVIIDNNSALSAITELEKLAINPDLHIIYNAINLGVAKALNQGIDWAIKNAYPWVILFDQDTIVSANIIEVLSETYQKIKDNDKIGIIGPAYFNHGEDNFVKNNRDLYSFVYHVITSGSLIPVELFKKIGTFQEELFIDFVDIEFCLRAKSKGYKVIMVNAQLMQHSIGAITRHKLPWKTSGTTNHSPLRRYYMMRNNIFIAKKYLFIFPKWTLIYLIKRIKSSILMLFFENQRLIKLKYSILGFIDGIFGKVNRKLN